MAGTDVIQTHIIFCDHNHKGSKVLINLGTFTCNVTSFLCYFSALLIELFCKDFSSLLYATELLNPKSEEQSLRKCFINTFRKMTLETLTQFTYIEFLHEH